MLDADAAALAEAVERIDGQLRDEIERLETSRKQIAQLTAGYGLVLPSEVAYYLDRLRAIGASERMVEVERDAWILVAARWPDRVLDWIRASWPSSTTPGSSGCTACCRSSSRTTRATTGCSRTWPTS